MKGKEINNMTTSDKNPLSGRWTVLALVLVLALAVLAWATMEQRKSIMKTANELGNCNTFVECVQKAGLGNVLEKDGPFSVFIPTDEAFSQITPEQLTSWLNNKSALTALLLYHMVPKKMTSEEMENVKDCMTCTVPQTSINCSSHSYGKGKCIQAAVPCTNGVIYLIDSVQIPSFLNQPAVVEEAEVSVVETISNGNGNSSNSPNSGNEPAKDEKKSEKTASAPEKKSAPESQTGKIPAVPDSNPEKK